MQRTGNDVLPNPYLFDATSKQPWPFGISPINSPTRFVHLIVAKQVIPFTVDQPRIALLQQAIDLANTEEAPLLILIGKIFYSVSEVEQLIYLPSNPFGNKEQTTLVSANEKFTSITHYLKNHPQFTLLRIGKNTLTLHNLKEISELPHLIALRLFSSFERFFDQVNSLTQQLSLFSKLTNLKYLQLRTIPIGNEGLIEIAKLSCLVDLIITDGKITDIHCISTLLCLNTLRLEGNNITVGYAEIQKLTALQQFYLGSCKDVSFKNVQLILNNQCIKTIGLIDCISSPHSNAIMELLAMQENVTEINLNYNSSIKNQDLQHLHLKLNLKKLHFIQSSAEEVYPVLNELAAESPEEKGIFFQKARAKSNKHDLLPLSVLSFFSLTKIDYKKLSEENISTPWEPLLIESNCFKKNKL